MAFAKGILDQVGVGGNRLEMFHMSSAMGKRWAEICMEMHQRILELGPNPVKRMQTAHHEDTKDTKGREVEALV